MDLMGVEKDCSEIQRIVNGSPSHCEDIGYHLAKFLHPTLQQNFMRVVIGFIRGQTEKEYFDARNEATGELCKQLYEELMKSKYYFDPPGKVLLPFI